MTQPASLHMQTPMIDDRDQQAMQTLLEIQIRQVNAYRNYLGQIKQAISSNDQSALEQLLNKVPEEASEIEQTRLQQVQLLQAAGFDESAQGLETFLEHCPQNEDMQKLAGQLNRELKKLQHALFVNSLLLQKSQQRVTQSIRILSGHSPDSSPASYTKSGNTERAGSDNRRSLAQA